MGSSLGQDGEVKREETKIEECGNCDQDRGTNGTVSQKLSVTQILPWQQPPVVLDQEVEAEEASVDANVLDTEGGRHQQSCQ